jgi:hypothetical protein
VTVGRIGRRRTIKGSADFFVQALYFRRTVMKMTKVKSNFMKQSAGALLVAAVAATVALPASAHDRDKFRFPMVRSAKLVASGCLPNATAKVRIKPGGTVERMQVSIDGLPPNTDFDFFVIQKPGAPFGLAWYQGDIETDEYGHGEETFIGRFNEETFIVAQGSVPAPLVHNNAFPDAATNPVTGPVHTFHLGLWFNSPADAVKAGCAGDVTPFNGEHNAGIQVLNTSNFPDLQGPLLSVKPKP